MHWHVMHAVIARSMRATAVDVVACSCQVACEGCDQRRNALEGPNIVETHSYILSPFGPAEQFEGGSREISASSFCMRLAADDTPEPLALELIGYLHKAFFFSTVSISTGGPRI